MPTQNHATLSFLAGTVGGAGYQNGSALNSLFAGPTGIARDAFGNTFIADTQNDVIREIDVTGTVSTYAGVEGQPGYLDGTARTALFAQPSGIAVDANGNVFVADTGNFVIRQITPAGEVSTLAGDPGTSGTTNGQGSQATFSYPTAIATDGLGNVFVGDNSDTIRKITSSGSVSTAAGVSGTSGLVNGPVQTALIEKASSIAVDSTGNIFFTDSSAVREVSAGQVSTFSSNATTLGAYGQTCFPVGLSLVPGGLDVETGCGVLTLNAQGVATPLASVTSVPSLAGIASDAQGNLYLTSQTQSLVDLVTAQGSVSLYAGVPGQYGNVDGTGSAARFGFASYGQPPSSFGGAMAADGHGNYYFADAVDNTIRKITADGVVTTIAGTLVLDSNGNPTGGYADGPAATAQFDRPQGIAVGPGGIIYVADYGNFVIRQISAAGIVSTVAGMPGNGINRVDGQGSAAQFEGPVGIAIDKDGTLYIADNSVLDMRSALPAQGCVIRQMSPDGTVTTIAGDPKTNGTQDGPASSAQFYLFSGIAIDPSGSIYVTDAWNGLVRKLSHGVVTTVAAHPQTPVGAIAIDGAGVIYVGGSGVIYTVDGSGTLTLYAGGPYQLGSQFGPLPARISGPYALAVNGNALGVLSLGSVVVIQ